jgi:hypothetical protein
MMIEVGLRDRDFHNVVRIGFEAEQPVTILIDRQYRPELLRCIEFHISKVEKRSYWTRMKDTWRMQNLLAAIGLGDELGYSWELIEEGENNVCKVIFRK